MRARRGFWAILASFALAMLLTAVPLPDWAGPWRPAWIALVLGYWNVALPERVGVGIAWFVGLLTDVLLGTLLGQHALGYAILAYLLVRSHKRIRMFPLAQQAVFFGGAMFVAYLIMLWVRLLIGLPSLPWHYWLPCLTSVLFWPWVFVILRDVRRRMIASG
jgi:rod shape-determining protein MreD